VATLEVDIVITFYAQTKVNKIKKTILFNLFLIPDVIIFFYMRRWGNLSSFWDGSLFGISLLLSNSSIILSTFLLQSRYSRGRSIPLWMRKRWVSFKVYLASISMST